MKNTKGFSILEVIIAIFVLTVGIFGVLKLITVSMKNTIDVRKQLVASELAQEGLELVRNIRDNNMLYSLSDLSIDSDVAFKRFIPGTDCSIDASYVYPTSGNLDCSSAPYLLYLNSATNVYSHASSGTETVFRRKIAISYTTETINGILGELSGMDVTSTVWWDGKDAPPESNDCNLANRCIEVKDYLAKRD